MSLHQGRFATSSCLAIILLFSNLYFFWLALKHYSLPVSLSRLSCRSVDWPCLSCSLPHTMPKSFWYTTAAHSWMAGDFPAWFLTHLEFSVDKANASQTLTCRSHWGSCENILWFWRSEHSALLTSSRWCQCCWCTDHTWRSKSTPYEVKW